MKRCPICFTEEGDGSSHVRECYCKRCLESDVATLRYIHSRAEKRRALGAPAKEVPKPR